MHVRRLVFACALLSPLALSGCAEIPRSSFDDRYPQPRVLSIGNGSVLTFARGRELSIPMDLAYIGSVRTGSRITVQVSGTSPPETDEYELSGINPSTGSESSGKTLLVAQPGKPKKDKDGSAPKPDQSQRPQAKPADQKPAGESNALAAQPEKPAGQQDAAQNATSFTEALRVILKGTYTQRLQSGDQVCIRINYVPTETPAGEPAGTREGQGAFGTVSRSFTVYEDKDYRDDSIKSHIPIHQIAAFPLPDAETTQLFGARTADRYYVVRLAIRNSSDKEQLVTSGMIRAAGRAFISPRDDQTMRFGIPVTVSPQEREVVYAVLEADEIQSPRAIVFRSLEFAGTLGTALANAFSWGATAIKGIGVYTGVGIPEGKKLFPDKFAGYKRNLVNYAMPAYVKVPKHSVSPPQFIFFSKDDIQNLVLDMNLFADLPDQAKQLLNPATNRELSSPTAYVAYLSFDNMEIPYEVVEVPNADTLDALNRRAASRVSDALAKMDAAEEAGKAVQDAVEAQASVSLINVEPSSKRKADADACTKLIPPAVEAARAAFDRVQAAPGSASAKTNAQAARAQADTAVMNADKVLAMFNLDAAEKVLDKVEKPDDVKKLKERVQDIGRAIKESTSAATDLAKAQAALKESSELLAQAKNIGK